MLEIRDLHVKFNNRDREAVGGISLTIHDGEIVGLGGISGSGKTVTAMSIAGLLPRKQCTYSGDILLNGQDLLHAKRSELRKLHGKEIGVVFQEPMSAMDPLMCVGKQVEDCHLRGRAGHIREIVAIGGSIPIHVKLFEREASIKSGLLHLVDVEILLFLDGVAGGEHASCDYQANN